MHYSVARCVGAHKRMQFERTQAPCSCAVWDDEALHHTIKGLGHPQSASALINLLGVHLSVMWSSCVVIRARTT